MFNKNTEKDNDEEWLKIIEQSNKEFEINSKYLIDKWLVYINHLGVFTKKIINVYGHEGDYVLKFSDNTRMYVETNDIEKLVEDNTLDSCMWLFKKDSDIHINENIQKDYIKTLDEIKNSEEHIKELKFKLDDLKKCLVKQCGCSSG